MIFQTFKRLLHLFSKFIIISILTPYNCKGQYEHFRNHESVFKNYQPYFEGVGNNVTSITGQTVTLQCDVRKLGDRYVSWLRESDLQVLSSGWTKFVADRRISVYPVERSHVWKLTIQNVQQKDSGRYICQVNTEPKITQVHYISVEESFAKIPGHTERGVQRGSSLELDCFVYMSQRNNSIVRWKHNNKFINSNDDILIFPSQSSKDNKTYSRLKIEYVRSSDAGVYTCISDGPAVAQVTVLVTSGEQRAAILDENNSGTLYLSKYIKASLIFILWKHIGLNFHL